MDHSGILCAKFDFIAKCHKGNDNIVLSSGVNIIRVDTWAYFREQSINILMDGGDHDELAIIQHISGNMSFNLNIIPHGMENGCDRIVMENVRCEYYSKSPEKPGSVQMAFHKIYGDDNGIEE